MNIEAQFSTHMEDSVTICQFQEDKCDNPDIDDINQVNTNIIALWQEIICYSSQLAKIDTNIEDAQFESNLSSHYGTAIKFLEILRNKIKMSEKLLTKVEYSYLNKNPQVIILCDIIKD